MAASWQLLPLLCLLHTILINVDIIICKTVYFLNFILYFFTECKIIFPLDWIYFIISFVFNFLNFYSPKLCIKNMFMNQIIINI